MGKFLKKLVIISIIINLTGQLCFANPTNLHEIGMNNSKIEKSISESNSLENDQNKLKFYKKYLKNRNKDRRKFCASLFSIVPLLPIALIPGGVIVPTTVFEIYKRKWYDRNYYLEVSKAAWNFQQNIATKDDEKILDSFYKKLVAKDSNFILSKEQVLDKVSIINHFVLSLESLRNHYKGEENKLVRNTFRELGQKIIKYLKQIVFDLNMSLNVKKSEIKPLYLWQLLIDDLIRSEKNEHTSGDQSDLILNLLMEVHEGTNKVETLNQAVDVLKRIENLLHS